MNGLQVFPSLENSKVDETILGHFTVFQLLPLLPYMHSVDKLDFLLILLLFPVVRRLFVSKKI